MKGDYFFKKMLLSKLQKVLSTDKKKAKYKNDENVFYAFVPKRFVGQLLKIKKISTKTIFENLKSYISFHWRLVN